MAEFATINCIYLLIEREYINSDQRVFKIGKTGNIQSRLTGYPKNSNILYLRYCFNKDICENILKLKFKEIFTHRQDIGAEYFEGDYIEMIKVINALLDNEVNVVEKLNADEQFIKNRKKELIMEELDLKKEKLVLQKQKFEIVKQQLNHADDIVTSSASNNCMANTIGLKCIEEIKDHCDKIIEALQHFNQDTSLLAPNEINRCNYVKRCILDGKPIPKQYKTSYVDKEDRRKEYNYIANEKRKETNRLKKPVLTEDGRLEIKKEKKRLYNQKYYENNKKVD